MFLLSIVLALILDNNGSNLFLESLLLTLINGCIFATNLFVKIGIFHLLIQNMQSFSNNLPLQKSKRNANLQV